MQSDRRALQAINSDRGRIERASQRAAQRIGLDAQRAATGALRRGRSPIEALRAVMEDRASGLLAEGMVAAHLFGRRRSALLAGRGRTVALRRTPYDEALRFLMGRLALSVAQVDELRTFYRAEALRVLAKTTASIERELETAALTAVRTGEHVREGTALLREVFARNGITPTNSFTVEAIFRTQTQLAFGAGRWQADQDEAVQEILWGYKYVTVGDDRVRPEHVGLDGVTLPKDDPQWDRIWPPNGWACRCVTISIFEPRRKVYVPDQVDVDGKLVRPGPDSGFEHHPGKVGIPLTQTV